ncbi:hypothetical protein ES703_113291 [subsurface metagenome]
MIAIILPTALNQNKTEETGTKLQSPLFLELAVGYSEIIFTIPLKVMVPLAPA